MRYTRFITPAALLCAVIAFATSAAATPRFTFTIHDVQGTAFTLTIAAKDEKIAVTAPDDVSGDAGAGDRLASGTYTISLMKKEWAEPKLQQAFGNQDREFNLERDEVYLAKGGAGKPDILCVGRYSNCSDDDLDLFIVQDNALKALPAEDADLSLMDLGVQYVRGEVTCRLHYLPSGRVTCTTFIEGCGFLRRYVWDIAPDASRLSFRSSCLLSEDCDRHIFSLAGYLTQNTAMIPLVDLAEGLGAEVTVGDNNTSFTIVKGGVKITHTANTQQMTVNGRVVLLPLPSRWGLGSWYIPLRAVAEALGATVTAAPLDKWGGLNVDATVRGTDTLHNYICGSFLKLRG